MVDYSKLSDFEINSAVHNAKLKEPYQLVFMGDNRIAWTKENGDQIITDEVPYTKNWVHNYCNNPADAWPIIVENRIRIIPILYTQWMAEDYLEDVSSYHENPLRAAMIVFLMMQDAENG